MSTTLTDIEGHYAFEDIAQGDYVVQFGFPEDALATVSDAGNDDGLDSDVVSEDKTAIISVNGQGEASVSAGFYFGSVITGRVWLDVNSDGIQDDDEAGTANFLLRLFNSDNEFVARSFSSFIVDGGTGFYRFENVAPGDYYVLVSAQDGVSYSPHNVTVSTMDSDINGDNGLGTTSTLQLSSGSEITHLDVGLILTPSTIGDRLWNDENGNGIQDDGEPGINGVTVELYNIENQKVGETVTAQVNGEDGIYLFEEIYPTEYYIRFVLGDEFVVTPSDLGGVDSKDSDINNSNGHGTTSIFLLSPAETDLDIDGGVFVSATIGNRVWHDRNLDGIQDDNEPGVRAVAAELFRIDADGVGVHLASTETDAQGRYGFDNIANGDYYVTFLPDETFEFTSRTSGSDTDMDSDVNKLGVTDIITISNNQSRLDVDAGLIRPDNQIGGSVWMDTDQNGVFSHPEPLLEGIVVWLMDDSGSLVSEQETGTAGRYLFDDLDDGDYQIFISPPAEFALTQRDFGGDDKVDSDFDMTGLSDVIVLSGETVMRHLDAGLIEDPYPLSTAYPNPVSGETITLKTHINKSGLDLQVEVHSDLGQKTGTIFRNNLEEGFLELPISVGQLEPGLHYMKILVGRKTEYVKFIKL